MKYRDPFLDHLRNEIIETQKMRAEYTRQKFTYIIGLLGAGSISIGDFKPLSLLYIVPIIAFAFDLYIFGSDFGIRRIGGFLGKKSTSTNEIEWEKWVGKNRDPFSKFAGILLSTVVLLLSATIIWLQRKDDFSILLYVIWISINLLLLFCTWYYSHVLNKKIHEFKS